jgi:hypothetical protein
VAQATFDFVFFKAKSMLLDILYRRPNGADGASLANCVHISDLPERNPELLWIQGIKVQANVSKFAERIFVAQVDLASL